MEIKKFEARTHTEENLTYGVWNNHMKCFQYIYEWDSTQTLDLQKAVDEAEKRNSIKYGFLNPH